MTALQIAASLPTLEKEITSALYYPQVGSLVLESERIRLDIDNANKTLARDQATISILTYKRDAIFEELAQLKVAKRRLSSCKRANSLASDFNKYSLICKERVADGLLKYANSWSSRRTEEESDFRLIALEYNPSLDESANALSQWQNLIEVPLGQLATFHASGITPADIAALIQAAGVGAIGAGVNK